MFKILQKVLKTKRAFKKGKMKCAICEKDTRGSCLCGFCIDCIKRYGHEKCAEMILIKNLQKKDE